MICLRLRFTVATSCLQSRSRARTPTYIHNLIVLYYSLARRLSEAETEKDFLRLKKKAGGYEKVLKKLYRSLGLPEDSNAAQDVLEESIIRRHNLVRLEVVEAPPDEGDLEGDEVWSD